jgi:hypothetical protein
MARDSKRAIAVFAGVGVALLVIGRFVIREETSTSTSAFTSTSTSTSTSTFTSASTSTSPRKARYESALVDASILALSSGAGTALAVGVEGTIYEHKLGVPKWTKMTAPSTVTLRAVAQQLDEAVAVGDDGTILELEGDAWKTVPSGTRRALRAVVYTSYGAVAVGDHGTIVRRAAPHEPWKVEACGTTNDLFGACAGLRDLWIVGSAGTIVTRALDAWNVQTSGTSALYAVACDDHAAIAVGEKGAMLQRLDDVGWHPSSSGVSVDLFAVSAPLGTTSFTVVGAAGTVIHVTRDAASEPPVLDFDLRAVTEGALGTWVAGEHGVFARRP